MNWESWLLSGLVATLALTTLISTSQGIGLTRMNLVYLLGTVITPRRERAHIYGFGLNLLLGWAFSILYVLVFEDTRLATWWFGLALGLAHALFVLAVGMSLMPNLHPRMASEKRGPDAIRQLEPPGFLGLNYGVQTPLTVLASHAAFGAILGSLYRLS